MRCYQKPKFNIVNNQRKLHDIEYVVNHGTTFLLETKTKLSRCLCTHVLTGRGGERVFQAAEKLVQKRQQVCVQAVGLPATFLLQSLCLTVGLHCTLCS